MNELIMTGYVATEPEINEFKRKRRRNKKTPQYGLAANFRISVKRSFKKKDGKKYDYFSCSAFDKSAEYIEEYIEEGDYIGIHGTLLNDNYENDDGDMVYKDKITVLRIELLRKRNDEEEGYDYEEESEDNDYDDEEYEEDDYENDYTKDLNMVADRLRARGEISRLQELCKEWLIPEKDMQDFLQGKRLRLAEVPLEEKIFSTASEKIAEEMYQFEGPGLAVALGQYLMERCEEKTLGEQILLPHKSLEKAINFILQRVYEESKDYLQQNRNGQNGAGVAVSSQKVYHWLEEYYALDDAEEERKKKEEERERKRKAQEKTVVKGVKTSVKESKTKKDSQISLFDMLEDREKTEEKNDCV